MYDLKYEKKFKTELNIPDFFNRYSNLLNSEKINIIIIKNEFDQSTFRYRAYNVIQTMKDNKKYNVNCFLYEELNELYSILDKFDLVILQRAFWSFEIESFVTILKENNIKVIFDMDDLIYSPRYVPEYLNNVGRYNEDFLNLFFSYSKRLELMAQMCDGFIVTTENLSNYIKKDFNKPVWIFHNYLNLEQEKVSEKIIELKKGSYSNEKFLIGYFSGSPSHKRDLEIAESALLKLMDKYDDIYLKIVGFMEFSKELQKLKDDGRILISDLVSFEELQYEIGKVDLNIVPLQKYKFNACKSELKYFEASIVNTLTLATDIVVYQNCIEDGVDGFLTDESSWFEKIEYIYLNYQNLQDTVDNARNKCLKEYGSKLQENSLEKMYDEIFDTLI